MTLDDSHSRNCAPASTAARPARAELICPITFPSPADRETSIDTIVPFLRRYWACFYRDKEDKGTLRAGRTGRIGASWAAGSDATRAHNWQIVHLLFQLQSFRVSVAKLLSEPICTPDYEIISRLQKMVAAHRDFTMISRRYDEPLEISPSRCTR